MNGFDPIAALLIVVLMIGITWAVIRSNNKIPWPETQQPAPEPEATAAQSDLEILSALLPPQFVVLDLETTGLNPLTDEIIEFGAILVTLGQNEHRGFQTLVRPSAKLPRRIIEITGITQQMVDASGIDIKEALRQFAEFIGDLPLVTYNAEFDMGFIHAAARRNGIAIGNRYTCALKRCRRAWPELENHRLAYVSEVMNLDTANSHRAIGDAARAMQVFIFSTMKINQKVRWSKPPEDMLLEAAMT